MKNLPTTRREFLELTSKGFGLLTFGAYAPEFLVRSTLASAPAPEKDKSILVLVQLAGGNDGLNTLIPFEDSNYYKLRPTLGIKKDSTLKVDDKLGLHPSCNALHTLYNEGKLSIIQNVGYPNPNKSHFRSTEIWETAVDSNEYSSTGWIGRFLDNSCAGMPESKQDPLAIHITNGTPQSFGNNKAVPTYGLSLRGNGRRETEESRRLLENISSYKNSNTDTNFLRQTLMNSLVTEKKVQDILFKYKPTTPYPNNNLGTSLKNVAALIAAGLPTRVYFVSISGFDTHSNQLVQHSNLLSQLSSSLHSFQKDLTANKLDGQVTTMTFSEFGRRPNENDSGGTDHGTAAPLFIMGSKVKGGVLGSAPSLKLQKNQDVVYSTDFREVYATVLENWLHVSSKDILSNEFKKLAFV